MENKELTNLKRQRTKLLNTNIVNEEQANYIQELLNEVEFKIGIILNGGNINE